MQDIDTAEARRLMGEIQDPSVRRLHIRMLCEKGETDLSRLDDRQLVLKILHLRRGATGRPPSIHAGAEAFAQATGNTYGGARIMIETDERHRTHTFVRGNASSDGKANPRVIKKLREAGHSPKPKFIAMKSGPDGMFWTSKEDLNEPSVASAMAAGLVGRDPSGYLIDTRERLETGRANPGFGKRYVSDVDLALVLSREGSGTARCDEATYAIILEANSWLYDQRCSCTHGAFTRWNATTPDDIKTKKSLVEKHLVDKSYGHRGLSTEQIGRTELLRPPRRVEPEDLRNATFKLLPGDPLIGFVHGRVFRTYIDRLYLDLIRLKLRAA